MFDGPRISECSALYVCDDDWRFHCIYVARSICYSYITQDETLDGFLLTQEKSFVVPTKERQQW